MSREAHVRFCESLGLQRPGPLTRKTAHKKKHKAKKKARRGHTHGRNARG